MRAGRLARGAAPLFLSFAGTRIMKRSPRYRPTRLAALALAAGLGFAAMAGAAEEGGEKKDAEPAAPVYKLSPPLDGKFDLSVLRSATRISEYRFPVDQIKADLPYSRARNAVVMVDIVLEFGAESGLAEVQSNKSQIVETLQTVMQNADPRRLSTLRGKMDIKESMTQALNRVLRTAQVRQVYITNFKIVVP